MDASHDAVPCSSAVEDHYLSRIRFYFKNRHIGDQGWRQFARHRFKVAIDLLRSERDRKREAA